MQFEIMLRQVLGDDAYQTASYFGHISLFKKYTLRAVKRLLKRVDELEMDNRLKDRLLNGFQNLELKIRELKEGEDARVLFVETMMIISRLLGFDWIKGRIYSTPVYTRNLHGLIADHVYAGPDKHFYNEQQKLEKSLFQQRIQIVKNLQERGYKTPEIAFILNTTDYQVKKLLGKI